MSEDRDAARLLAEGFRLLASAFDSEAVNDPPPASLRMITPPPGSVALPEMPSAPKGARLSASDIFEFGSGFGARLPLEFLCASFGEQENLITLDEEGAIGGLMLGNPQDMSWSFDLAKVTWHYRQIEAQAFTLQGLIVLGDMKRPRSSLKYRGATWAVQTDVPFARIFDLLWPTTRTRAEMVIDALRSKLGIDIEMPNFTVTR